MRKVKARRKRRTKRKQKRTAPKRKRKSPKRKPKTTALVPVASAPIARRERGLRPEQIALLQRTVAKGTSPDELALFLLVARKHKLDPFTRQLHCVMRYDKALGRDKMVIQIGIDGYRAMAARSHRDYGSVGEPEFEYKEDGSLLLARVKVWRKGHEHATVAVAFWDEYKPDMTSPQAFKWRQMPKHMLAKCAEALALRKAYPDLADIYADEEMAQADIDLSPEGREVTDTEGRPLSAPTVPPAPPAPDPPADSPMPTDPPQNTLAKINDYKEVKWRNRVYVKVQYGNWECTCWKKDLWPYLKEGVGEQANLVTQRNGNYLNIMGIKSIGAQTFSQVEGKSVPDIQHGDHVKQPPPRERPAPAASPPKKGGGKVTIAFQGDSADLLGDTYPIKEKIKEGMAGKWDKDRKCWVIPSAWVPTLTELCEEQGIGVEEVHGERV